MGKTLQQFTTSTIDHLQFTTADDLKYDKLSTDEAEEITVLSLIQSPSCSDK
jgi:hypothetical protein